MNDMCEAIKSKQMETRRVSFSIYLLSLIILELPLNSALSGLIGGVCLWLIIWSFYICAFVCLRIYAKLCLPFVRPVFFIVLRKIENFSV